MVRTSQQHIRDWLKALGSLAASTLTAKEFDARISAYVPLLAADFPMAAFGPVSLAVVARHCKFFPSYAEICEVLSPWWRENRPAPVVNALHSPNGRTHDEWREIAEQSWRDITAAEVRAKIVEIQRAGAGSAAFARISAHAVTTHAPHHTGILAPGPGSHHDRPRTARAALCHLRCALCSVRIGLPPGPTRWACRDHRDGRLEAEAVRAGTVKAQPEWTAP